MTNLKIFKPPLAVYFVWHPDDRSIVQELVEYSKNLLQKDSEHPFSRTLGIPVFFRTSTESGKLPIKLCPSAARSNIVFCFVGRNIICDKKWMQYYKNLQVRGIRIIPLALDRSAIGSNNPFDKKNYIKVYEFGKDNKRAKFLIAVLHEIYRFALNRFVDKSLPGKESSVKLFLSHTKKDKWAVKLAKVLKTFIDNTNMKNYFDATDTAPAFSFDEEIKKHLEESTLIAIHSDSYSSKYWCQKEILLAKEKMRPMICVDHLKSREDRIFPYSANIPCVHLTPTASIQKTDLYRIVETALLETVRFHYHNVLLNAYAQKNERTLVLPRPPETADISRIIEPQGKKIIRKYDSIIYPDPPIYGDELQFYKKLGINAHTPTSIGNINLKNIRIGISISDVNSKEFVQAGLPDNILALLAQDFARNLLARNAGLVYGGNLSEGGFTEYLFEEAAILKDRLKKKYPKIWNFLAWPIYANSPEILKKWEAEYSDIAELKKVSFPREVKGIISTSKPSPNPYIWSVCLTKMRQEMISKCDARICAGGKTFGFKGRYPGILEEIMISLERNKPLYLLGGFGGMTKRICDLLKNSTIPDELNLEWQKKQTAGYENLVKEIQERKPSNAPDYEYIVKLLKKTGIKGLSKTNHLTLRENIRLFETPFLDEAIFLLLKGINRI